MKARVRVVAKVFRNRNMALANSRSGGEPVLDDTIRTWFIGHNADRLTTNISNLKFKSAYVYPSLGDSQPLGRIKHLKLIGRKIP